MTKARSFQKSHSGSSRLVLAGLIPELASMGTTRSSRMLVRNNERHRTARTGWLRAAVLGANDGILSTASLVLGVAAAHATHRGVLVAGVAALVAGAKREITKNKGKRNRRSKEKKKENK